MDAKEKLKDLELILPQTLKFLRGFVADVQAMQLPNSKFGPFEQWETSEHRGEIYDIQVDVQWINLEHHLIKAMNLLVEMEGLDDG